jgi:hypothetical protein
LKPPRGIDGLESEVNNEEDVEPAEPEIIISEYDACSYEGISTFSWLFHEGWLSLYREGENVLFIETAVLSSMSQPLFQFDIIGAIAGDIFRL